MYLSQHYFAEIDQAGFEPDRHQLEVVKSLDDLSRSLRISCKGKLFFKLLCALRQASSSTKGRYIWGGVGRGKSWLLEIFFLTLPLEKKVRLNYQEFMQQVHLSLEREKGHGDPLGLIAKRFANMWSVICLDEFVVEDITDAMLWHGLLQSLKAEGVVLLMTSNLPPNQLYLNGLQRERFLPAIELIEQSMDVLHLAGENDYRRSGSVTPQLSSGAVDVESHMRQLYYMTVGKLLNSSKQLLINRRYINALCVSDKTAWFDFGELCAGPRSAQDYIELSNRFKTLFISHVPVFTEDNEDQAHRFIQLIDELYDRKIDVVIGASTSASELYQGRRYQFEFRRTTSRLETMQYMWDLREAV